MPKAANDTSPDPERCGQCLDERGLHLHNCPMGSRRFRPHNSVVQRTARLLKYAGAHVDIERACPELYVRQVLADGTERVREAILDVVATFSGSASQRKLDVTIRSPFSKMAMKRRSLLPGAAALAGERAKAPRYGVRVLPLSFESLGRLGKSSLATLETLRSEARLFGRAFFNVLGSALDWRRQLETVLMYEISDAALLCLGRHH